MNRKLANKIIIIAGVFVLIAAFNFFDLGRYLTLSYIKDSQKRFQMVYLERRFFVIACYMLIYVLVTSLSLPGATMLTLAGGALFGLYVGTVVVSLASTIGATLACLVSRFLLRDWVQGRFGDKLSTVNEGIRKKGAFYLFTMRLIPAFPFFVINLVMGLTKMRLFTFFWVSQVGMIPGTVVMSMPGRNWQRLIPPVESCRRS